LWAAAFEAGVDTDEDEESAACHTLERGFSWVRRTFDELILPVMMVSSLDAMARSCFLSFFQYS
jgi:hypothetical protein